MTLDGLYRHYGHHVLFFLHVYPESLLGRVNKQPRRRFGRTKGTLLQAASLKITSNSTFSKVLLWRPKGAPIFLYHSRDDEIVPFAHMAIYAKKLPQATIRKFNGRGHQFNNDLSEVAKDITSL